MFAFLSFAEFVQFLGESARSHAAVQSAKAAQAQVAAASVVRRTAKKTPIPRTFGCVDEYSDDLQRGLLNNGIQ
jgi:hypothetical protein